MAVVLALKVVPQSRRRAVAWDEKNGTLKVFLTSAPEKNKANEELCHFLRKLLGIPRSAVAIIGGHTARRKRVALSIELSYEQVLAQLGVHGIQQAQVLS